MTRREWTPDEDQLLIDIYKDIKIKDLIPFFNNRTYLSIKHRIHILKIGKKENPEIWGYDEIEKLKNIYTNLNIDIENIKNEFPNRSWQGIKFKANSLKLIRRKKFQYKVNENYFDNINTMEQAYFIGFIAADGSVYNNIFKLKINIKDSEIIYNLNKVLLNGYIPKINNKSNTINLQISNKKILIDLSKYNIIHQKTMHYTWPDILPTELEMPFLLGYFDGDGSLHKRNDKSENSWVWQLYGRYNFLMAAKSKIETHVNIQLTDPHKAAGKELYNLSISGKKVKLIDEYMSQYDIGLKRKRIQYFWDYHEKPF